MAHNLARNELNESAETAIERKTNFTYETNFNSSPLYWPKKFKSSGFKIRLIFFCMDSVEEAQRRVQIRVENGGHYVPKSEVVERYCLGYKNLNEYWEFFDEVYLFNTSRYDDVPNFLFSIINGKTSNFKEYPDFLKKLIPGINIQNQS